MNGYKTEKSRSAAEVCNVTPSLKDGQFYNLCIKSNLILGSLLNCFETDIGNT